MDGTLWRRHCKSVWNNRPNDEKQSLAKETLVMGNTAKGLEGLTQTPTAWLLHSVSTCA